MSPRSLRTLGFALLTLVSTLAHAGDLTPAAMAKIDVRLLNQRTADCTTPRMVWLEFADKGEVGPSDLARRLGDARALLSPRALSRRERAGVSPLVDWYDLPVHQPYVDALVERGYRPFGASRWFNRVAILECDDRMLAAAEFSFVRRITMPERGRADRVRETSPPYELPPVRSGTLRSEGSLDYGVMRNPMNQVGVPALHDSGYTGAGVLIAVLDEGFNYFDKHEALRDLDVAGRTRDFVEGDLVVQDTVGSPGIYQHGTWCLGAMAGYEPGRYVGPAFGASFALGRTEYSASETPAEMVWWGMGAEWADSLGADIVSSSLGYNTFDDPYPDLTLADLDGHTSTISRAAQIAASRGMLVVSSAGNSGNIAAWNFRILFPADVNGDSLLAVGAVDSNGVLASFSSQGPTADGRTKPDVVARGRSLPLASASGNPQAYTTGSGTSFSCPIVAGLAACLWQAHPDWPAVWIAEALKRTASRAASPDNLYGWGIPNGPAALRYQPDTAGVPPTGQPIALRMLGPNPLLPGGPDARLRFGAAVDGFARLRVLDAQGRVVRVLHEGQLAAGQSLTISWNGRGKDGRRLEPGIYFAQFELGGRSAAVRMASLR